MKKYDLNELIEQVSSQVYYPVFDQVSDQFYKVKPQILDAMGREVWYQICFRVWNRVFAQAMPLIKSQIFKSIKEI